MGQMVASERGMEVGGGLDSFRQALSPIEGLAHVCQLGVVVLPPAQGASVQAPGPALHVGKILTPQLKRGLAYVCELYCVILPLARGRRVRVQGSRSQGIKRMSASSRHRGSAPPLSLMPAALHVNCGLNALRLGSIPSTLDIGCLSQVTQQAVLYRCLSLMPG